MDWEQLGAIGEIAGAIGVILSMLYLSRQITENTKFTKLSTHNETMSKFMDVMIANAQNRELSSVIVRGMKDPHSLDEVEMTMFAQRLAVYFMAWFNAHHQYSGGLLEREFWETCERDIAGVMRSPGYVFCWEQLKGSFTDDFVSCVEQIVKSDFADVPNYYPSTSV